MGNVTESRAQRNIRWIESNCFIPEGKFAGKPFLLTDEQKEWIHTVYDSPTRMFILSMGRKNAKTTFCAVILILHLCGPEAAPNTQLYSAAQARDQAALTFDLAAKIVRLSPNLRPFIQIRDTAKELLCPELGTFYKALSAEASTNFGKSPKVIIHDELGQVRGPRSEMFDALETACAAHEDPLSLVISTQAATDEDLMSIAIDDALTGADPRIKIALYSAPLDLDPFSDEAIRAANPHFDSFMNQEEVRKQASDAKRMPSKESAYRNFVLNQRIEARSPFVARSTWDANGQQPEATSGRCRVWGGLDLSAVNDLTALVLVDPTTDSAGWNVRPVFWLPEVGLAEKARSDRVPYDVWREQGHLLTTPGGSIEYEFIATYLRTQVFDVHDVQAIAFDRYNWKFLKPWLEKVGFSEQELMRFVEFGQGYVSMSPAIRELEAKLLGLKLRHGNHPVLTMCASNATVMSDPAGNRKFVKGRTTGRIDGMVALTMAIGSVPQIIEEPQPKFFFF